MPGQLGELYLKITPQGVEVVEQALSRVKGETKKTTSELEKMGLKLKKELMSILPTIGAAAIVKGLSDIATGYAKAAEEVKVFAAVTGLSTLETQRLGYAAKLAEVDLGELRQMFRFLSLAVGEYQDKSSKTRKLFEAMGIDPTGMSMREVFLAVIDGLKRIGDEGTTSEVAMALFGRSFMSVKKLLEEGSEGIRSLEAEFDNLGIAMDDAALKRGKELEDSLKRNQEALKGVRNEIGFELAPTILWFNRDVILPLVKTFRDLAEESKTSLLGGILSGLSGPIGGAIRLSEFIKTFRRNAKRPETLTDFGIFEEGGGLRPLQTVTLPKAQDDILARLRKILDEERKARREARKDDDDEVKRYVKREARIADERKRRDKEREEDKRNREQFRQDFEDQQQAIADASEEAARRHREAWDNSMNYLTWKVHDAVMTMASAMESAWAKGEDGLKAFVDSAKKMLESLIKQLITAAITALIVATILTAIGLPSGASFATVFATTFGNVSGLGNLSGLIAPKDSPMGDAWVRSLAHKTGGDTMYQYSQGVAERLPNRRGSGTVVVIQNPGPGTYAEVLEGMPAEDWARVLKAGGNYARGSSRESQRSA